MVSEGFQSGFRVVRNCVVSERFQSGLLFFFLLAGQLVHVTWLFVHHRLMRGEKSVHNFRIGAKPFVHCET